MPDPEFVVVELAGRKGGVDAARQRTHTRRWRVTAPSPEYGDRRVLLAVSDHVGGLGIGTPYAIGDPGDPEADPPVPPDPWREADTFCLCNALEAQQADVEGDGDGVDWIVTASYGPLDPDQADNPLDQEPEVEWSFASYERVADRALDDDNEPTIPIVNTALDPFDPPVELDDPRPVLTVTVNLAWEAFNPALAYSYRNAVNADEFFGVPAGYVKAMPPRARKVVHPEVGRYWQVTYEFHFNPDGWVKFVLNQGTRQLNADGDGYESILTETGQPVSDPVPLDADGRALPPDGEPIWLPFTVYPVRPFPSFYGFGGS